MEEKVYTITYFRNGEYFMVSSNAFRNGTTASRCAKRFCETHLGDKDLWTFDIEELIMR